MVNTYAQGSLVRVATYSGTVAAPVGGFRDINGNLADPATVTLKYKPGQNMTTVVVVYPASPIVKDAVGLYHADLDTTSESSIPLDEWTYEWIGFGTIQAAAQSVFEVQLGL
jgi:hypothetical protein